MGRPLRYPCLALACLTVILLSPSIRADSLKLVCPADRGGIVKIEGIETGRCPGEFELPSGTYQVEVTFASGQSWTKAVTTRPDAPLLLFPVPTVPASTPADTPPPLVVPDRAEKPTPPAPGGCQAKAKPEIKRADELVAAKKLAEAVEAYTTALLEDPECAEAWHKIAVANAKRGEYQLAIAQWNKVLALMPDNQIAKRNIARAEKKLKTAEAPAAPAPKPEPLPGESLSLIGVVAGEGLNIATDHLDRLTQALQAAVARRKPPTDAQAYAVRVLAFSTQPMICPADPAQAKLLACPPEKPIVKATLNLQLIYYAQPTTPSGSVVPLPVGTFSAPAPVEVIAHEPLGDQQAISLEAISQSVDALMKRLAAAPEAQLAAQPPPPAPGTVLQPAIDVPDSVVYEDPTLENYPSLSGEGINYDLNLTLQHMGDLSFDGSTKYSTIYRRASRGMSFSTQFKMGGDFNIAEDVDDTASLFIGGSAGPMADSARLTTDFYLVSDLFFFIEPQVNARLNHGSDDPEPTLAIFSGFGWGRTLPVACYFRVRDVLRVLHKNRLLKRELTPEEIQLLMEVITNRWDGITLADRTIEELTKMGLLVQEPDRAVKKKLVETILESYGYKEQGRDYRIGVHYNILTGEASLVSDLPQLAASWTMKIPWGRWFFEPLLASYLMLDPFAAAFLAGATLSYQPSLRSKYVLGELFITAVGDFDTQVINTLFAEYRYWITNLITASVRASATKTSGTDLNLQLSLNIGLATF